MINLRSNYPSLERESEIFTHFVPHHLNKEKLLQQPFPIPSQQWFQMLSPWLDVPNSLLNTTSRIENCSSASSAIFAILFAFRTTHSVIGVEAFTYSGLKATAELLGYKLRAIDCDVDGLKPDSVKTAIEAGVALFYVQPTIHNPTCIVMSEQRRKDVADVIASSQAMLIEDDAYRFLHPNPPSSFLKLLPQKTIHIYSLAKPFNSFIKSCFIILPKSVLSNLSSIIEEAGSTVSSMSFLFSRHLLQLEDFKELIIEKRERAKEIQQLIQPILQGLHFHTFETSYHIWISLLQPFNSKDFSEQLRKKNILVTGSHECSANGNTGFIRLALSAEKDATVLQDAMRQITQLLTS